jgi:ketose-bisphosphate aldolase
MGLSMAATILLEAKRRTKTEVCVHFDHGREVSRIDLLQQVVDLGLDSIMVDGSSLPLQENLALCKAVVELAHPRGICVEGELGRVSRNLNATQEELNLLMTDPDEAAELAEKSGVDYLAVSVGSISGFVGEQATVRLELDRLERIAKKVPVPLVFHGGSGIPSDQIRQAIRLGVAKVNIAHGFRKAFLDGSLSYINSHPGAIDPRIVLGAGARAAEEFARRKIGQTRAPCDV